MSETMPGAATAVSGLALRCPTGKRGPLTQMAVQGSSTHPVTHTLHTHLIMHPLLLPPRDTDSCCSREPVSLEQHSLCCAAQHDSSEPERSKAHHTTPQHTKRQAHAFESYV